MGMGQSTPRRLTVRNDEPRIIQVSEDVIRRLSAARSVESNQELPTVTTTAKAPPESYTTTTTVAPAKQIPIQTYRESNVSKAEVLSAEEEFRRKLAALEKLNPGKKEDKCKDFSAKVAECYSNHPTQLLRCSKQVKDFAECAYRVAWVAS